MENISFRIKCKPKSICSIAYDIIIAPLNGKSTIFQQKDCIFVIDFYFQHCYTCHKGDDVILKPQISTERLILRAFCDHDLDATVSILTNDCVKKTYMLPDFPTPQDAEPLFRKLMSHSQDPQRYVFAIALDEKVIGFMNDVEMKDGKIEVGYVIHPDHHNKGYATEALKALIDHLHTEGFHTVVAGYFSENPASGRVMEKAGMQKSDYTDEIEYRGQNHRCLYFESIR